MSPADVLVFIFIGVALLYNKLQLNSIIFKTLLK